MKLFNSQPGFFIVLILFFMAGCTAPRSVIHSGKVTPKGQFKGGFNFTGNLATQPLSAATDATESLIDNIKGRDSVYVSDAVTDISKAVLAYTLDPASPNFDFYVRYGLAKRIDVGYKYAFGTHVIDGMFQFMGSTGTQANPGKPGTYGSVGLQFSRQNTNLPGSSLLEDAADLLHFSATRTDILIPLVFSKSFGEEESIGNISYGVAYNLSFVSYTFEPSNFFIKQASNNIVPVAKVSGTNSYGSFGIFTNAKFGYKYVYVLPAFAMYYQNYGTYELPGGQKRELKGFTFIPSIGLQVLVGKGK